jgi:hypothetical protein
MKHFLFLFLFFSLTIQAQFQVNGIIKDILTNKALPFATITTRQGENTISDVDGKFTLNLKTKKTSFEVSYVGFIKQRITIISEKKYYTVLLLQKTNDLNEVIIAHENPALVIIRKAIENKKQNNPEKRLNTFEYKSYNRLVVTANPDSLDGKLDSLFVDQFNREKFTKIDSSNYKFKEIIQKQHLFQTEKISQYQFVNSKSKETILATKMSGFKQPIYEILGFNLQSLSVYDNKYELFDTKYVSPIDFGALKRYNFKLLDTLSIDNRKVFMVYFKNKKKSKASGLEGILYIDTLNYAIAKAVMRIKGLLDISATHEFEYLSKENLWFPITKSFKIVKGNNDDDINFLGGTIEFEGDVEKNFKKREKQASDYTYLISKTNNFDFRYNTPIRINRPSIAIEIKDDAINKSEAYWNSYRKDSLDMRSIKTYSALDSIAVKNRIESRLRFGRKIINGFLPLGNVDLNLRKIVSYNNYEGLRLGFGGTTNERFSKKYKIEGYTAYGLKDEKFKYSLGTGTRLGKVSNSWIGISHTNDILEIASSSFAIDKRMFKLYDPRPINISTFYHFKSWKTFIETKIIPKTESVWELSNTLVEPKFDYTYNLNGKIYKNYTMTTAMVSLRWNPFSNYMQTPTGRIETDKRYPKFTFQITKSLPKIAGNDFEFSKIDFRTEYEKKYLNGQKTSLLFETGYTFGDVPITHLYNTSPNNLNKDGIIQRITFGGKNSFETMYFNEFFSSKFAFFQFKHGFNRITLLKKIKPSLVLVSRMAWGNIKKPEQHIGIEFKGLDKGFFESGIELNQIYNGLGLSGFYRYGPNQLEKFEDNIAVKLTFILNLGL